MSSKKRPNSVFGTAPPGLSTCTVTTRVCANAICACRSAIAISNLTIFIDLRLTAFMKTFIEQGTKALISLCNLCVLCVSVVNGSTVITHHRDTENTEVAQRRASSTCGPGFSLARHASNELNLLDHVRRTVVAKNFVKPDRRFAIGVRVLPRIPRQIRLRLALREAPVDHPHVMNLSNRQTAE